jgi:hypothetical protein
MAALFVLLSDPEELDLRLAAWDLACTSSPFWVPSTRFRGVVEDGDSPATIKRPTCSSMHVTISHREPRPILAN